MKRVGLIGIGLMGQGIARNILKHGIPLTVYDIRPEAADNLVRLGAKLASSTAKLGETADTVLLIVNSAANCKNALSGLLETLHGGTVINMSTVGMDAARELESMVTAAGCRMLDCPMSGGTAAAADGTLTLMVSGDKDVLEANRFLLGAFGKNIIHVGKLVGQGQAVKTVNQMLVSIHMCAAAEAFHLAEQCGLDLQTVYDVIQLSAGNSRIFENRGKFFIERNFDSRSTLQIQLKDTEIAMNTAESVGAQTLLCAAARELFKLAGDKYPPSDDPIEVIRLYEEGVVPKLEKNQQDGGR